MVCKINLKNVKNNVDCQHRRFDGICKNILELINELKVSLEKPMLEAKELDRKCGFTLTAVYENHVNKFSTISHLFVQ